MDNSILQKVLKVVNIRKKIGVTLSALLLYKIGSYIPIPLICHKLPENTFQESYFPYLLNFINGKCIINVSILAIGIFPYFIAKWIVFILQANFPSFQVKSMFDVSQKERVSQITKYISILISIIFALFYIKYISVNGLFTAEIQKSSVYILSFLILIAGHAFLLWIRAILAIEGFGRGEHTIVLFGAFSSLTSSSIFQGISNFGNFWKPFFIFYIIIGVMCLKVFVDKAQINIPIKNLSVSNKWTNISFTKDYIPVSFGIIVSQGIQCGLSVALFFAWLLQKLLPSFYNILLEYPTIYLTLTGLILVFFAFFLESSIIDPTLVSNNLSILRGFIPGIRPGKATANHLETHIFYLTYIGTVLHIIIILILFLIKSKFSASGIIVGIFFHNSTSIVIYNFISSIEAEVSGKSYNGFFDND